MSGPPRPNPAGVRHEAANALRDLSRAWAVVNFYRHILPAPLVELFDAVHTLANVESYRLDGQDPGSLNLKFEREAWDSVLKAWSARPGQDADSLKFKE